MSQQYIPFEEEQDRGNQEIPINNPPANNQESIAQQSNRDNEKNEKNKKSKKKVAHHSSDSSSSSDEDTQPILKKANDPKKNDKKKTKSLQLQQMELEEANKKSLKWAIRLRSFSRIVFLIITTTVLFTGFYAIFEFFAFYDGMQKINSNSRLTMNITNCRVHVIDSVYEITKSMSSIKYLGASVTTLKSRAIHTRSLNDSDIDGPKLREVIDESSNLLVPDFTLEYSIPGRFNIDPHANTSTVTTDISGSNYSYEFTNILSAQSCQIDLHVYKQAALDDLSINCLGSCFILMTSNNISYNTVNITGELVELNAVNLETKNFTFDSIQGRFQGNYLNFEQFSDIRLENGDIVIQTDKEMMVNWTHANPHYCYSAPVIANPIVVGCQEPPASEVKAFITGVGTGQKKKKGKKDDDKDDDKDEKDGKDGKDKKSAKDKDDGGKIMLEEEDDEIYETFFEDEHENLQGNIILLPFAGTYNESKNYKHELNAATHLEEGAAAKADDKDKKPEGDSANSTKKANMQSKTKEDKESQSLLFQPSCYGNSIFCSSLECKTIKDALAKSNNTITPVNSTGNPDSQVTKGGKRILKEEEEKKKEKTNSTDSKSKNKTETKIDYKGINAQAQKVLPHTIPAGVRFLNVTGRFGNVYVNIIKKQNKTVNNKDTVIHGISYASGSVEFDFPSQKILKHYLKQAEDPHNFDPNFVLKIGSKITRSDNYQQWSLTYNPAYSYVRPWWMGTFSFTLMSTASWALDLNLSPGFCPYFPSLDLNDIYNTRFLIGKYFEKAEHSITTLSWQNSVKFPTDSHPKLSTGLRKYIESNNEFERWVEIIKLNETSYQLTNINLDQSPATKWAVVVSVVISILTAFFLILGVLYMINSVYKQILEQVAATNKYSGIEKKNDAGAAQPLMKMAPEQDDQPKKVVKESKDDSKEGGGEKKSSNESDMEITLNLNLGRLLYQLFVLAPPLSAFIDYLCVLISKKYINSAEEFYTHLFQKKQKSNVETELHDLTTESIIGNEMKTLYEKFCFLNGLLEQKLDDETNVKLLKQKGFKISVKQDAQTESYVRVLSTGLMPKLPVITPDKQPLALFIENCCKVTNFEEDNMVVQTFNEQFQSFCVLNHLPYETPSASELQKNYNITSKYIAQQWVERDEEIVAKTDEASASFMSKVQDCLTSCLKKCLPEQQTFIINRQKMQNHYSLILNNPEQIKTKAELAEANRELILFGGWWMVDFFTVLAHFITTVILIIPLFSFTILEKILYAQYSLIPVQYLITLEDILQNYWLVPLKLYNESSWIKNVLILVGIYWVYSIIDLLYYYISMEFPQENFFRKVSPKTANRIQLIFRQIMWALVLYSAYQLCVFLTLALVWLLLGAIVNPTAFLPYATAAATFLTVISSKAAQFKEIATDGFDTVIKYVQNIAKEQMGGMIAKMDLKGKMHDVMDSGAFKSIAGQAASLGLVDSNTLAHIEENADAMLSDPDKALEAGSGAVSELQAIAANPAAFVAKMMKELEEKAVSLIKEQMKKQIEGFGEELANISLAIFKKDKNMFKNNLTQLMYAAANTTKIEALKKMGQPIMTFIWEFAYPNTSQGQMSPEDYIEALIGPCAECISQLIQQEIQVLFQDQATFEPRVLTIVLKKAISLYQNLQAENNLAVFNDIDDIIKHLKDEPQFTQIKYLQKYSGLLKIAMALFEGRKGNQITFHKIFSIISGFFDEIPQLKEMKDLLGMIELLVNSFNKQHKALPTKLVRQRITKSLDVVNDMFSKQKNQRKSKSDALLENPSLITLIFNFMQHNFEKIPKEVIRDVFKFIFDHYDDIQVKTIKELVITEREHKKLIPLMTGIFEMVALFMEDSKEITQCLHLQASAFSIDEKKAQHLQAVASIKYLRFITYEGSDNEEKLFEKLQLNPLLTNLSTSLRLDIKVLLGIISCLLQLYSKQNLQDLYQAISKINKIEVKRIKQFFQILILFKSDNATHLSNACVDLAIPRQFIILVLLSKKVLDITFADEENLAQLGASDDTIKWIRNPEFELKQWLQKLKKDVIAKEDQSVQGGNAARLKTFLIDTISDSACQITGQKVVEILLDIGNNDNQFAELTKNEIDLLTNILLFKNIDLFSQPQALTSDTKQSVYTFASTLNVNKQFFEDFINIVFLTNSDRVIQSIQSSQPKIDANKGDEFIQKDLQKDYENYLEFMYSKMEMIQRKYQFIYSKFQKLFPMIRLPMPLVEKLLFNKDRGMDINSFYQLAYLIIEKDEGGKLPKGTLRQLNKSVSFLTSTLNSQTIKGLKQALDKNDLNDGQALVIQMLNENSKQRSLTLLLNFLMENSKRSKNDVKRPLPQVYHVFSCLYLYFTGQWSDLSILVEDQETKQNQNQTILQYLIKKLDIKQEFFEAIHTFFLNDNQKFTQIMVKFMRRQQACKFEKENPGVKIPLQSLVKIPDQFVLNFINLITGAGYQTSFFSKELSMDSGIVLLISTLTNIQNSKTSALRVQNYQYLSSSSQKLGPLLDKVGVKGDEFVLLLQLLFQDYDTTRIQSIINGFRLESKLKVQGLQNLLMLDKVIDSSDKDWLKQIQSIKDNQLIKDMRIDPNMAVLAKGLCGGKYGGLESYVKKFPHLDYAQSDGRPEYFGLLQGLIGCISCPIPEKMNVKSCLTNIYKLLEDPKTKDIPVEFTPQNNSFEHAVFKLVQIIQIDPMILMLTQGIVPAWKLLQETYTNIYNEENKWLNPVLVLQTFLTFQAIPTLIKEIIGECEWYEQMDQALLAIYRVNIDYEEELKKNKEEDLLKELEDIEYISDPDWKDQQLDSIEELKKKLFTDTIDSLGELQDMVEICGFNSQIIQLLNITKNDVKNAQLDVLADAVELYAKLKDDDEDLLEISRLIKSSPPSDPSLNRISYEEAVDQVKQDPDEQKRLKDMKPLILYTQMVRVYKECCSLFVDPRRIKTPKIMSDEWLMKEIMCDEVPIFTMGVSTTLASLRRTFWNPFEGMQPRDDEHYKIAVHQIDFLLTSIERMYYFKNFTDYFSKIRAAVLIGLSCGFIFSAEHFISANCTAGLVTYETAVKNKELSKAPYKKLLNKWRFIKEIIENREERYSGRANRFFKTYQFNKVQKYSADIITEPENYLKFSIQNVDGQPDQGINWDDYFYDIGFLAGGSQLAKWVKLEDIDTQRITANTRPIILREKLKRLMNADVTAQYGSIKKTWQDQQKQAIEPKQVSSKEPTFDEAVLEISDVRSGKKWQSVLNSQDIWSQHCYTVNENMRLLIDIWKGNFQSIIEPDTYFTDEEPTAAMAYYGITALSGAFYKVRNGWKQNSPQQISAYLNACCWNTSSNKKNMQEILSVFLKSFEGMTVLAQSLQQDINLVNSFVNLSMGLSIDDASKSEDQLVLIKAMQLSSNDTDVLNQLIDAYIGKMDAYYQLADYSLVINPNTKTKFKPVQMNNLIKKKRGDNQPAEAQAQVQVQKPEDEKKPQDEVVQKEPTLVPEQPPLQVQNSKQDQKKGAEKKGKPKIKFDLGSSGDRYYQVKTLLLKLLYGFDQSQLHQQEKIDPIRFDFSKYSALSADPKKTEEYFILLLWQLAQAVTKETLPNELRLPILTDYEINQDNELANEYKRNIRPIKLLTQFLVQLVNDDYSFFFRNDDDVSEVLVKMALAKDQPIAELQFMRAMIGLKSNKMMFIQNKKKSKKKESVDEQVKLDLKQQVQDLIESKIIAIKLEKKNEEQNLELSKNIAQLFLAISSGNIEKMFTAILPHDAMSACFILTMFMWKNISTIISNDEFLEPNQAERIIPALQLLPLLVYSQINEQQDKKNGKLRNDKREHVVRSFQQIIKMIKSKGLDNSFYDKIEKKSQGKGGVQSFSWSLWILRMPEFLKVSRDVQKTMKFEAQYECEFLFGIITGYFFVEKAEPVKFIGPIINLYKVCNQIINYPEMMKIKNIDFKNLIPNTITSISDYVPDQIRTYLGVFDQFIQLFVFIQIPEKSLMKLKSDSERLDKLQNSGEIGRSQQGSQYGDDDEYNEDEGEEEDDEENDDDGSGEHQDQGEEKKQEVQDGGLAQITETINEFILDVLGQTVTSLWASFKEENRQALNDQIEKLQKEINEKKVNLIKEQNKRVSGSVAPLPMIQQGVNQFNQIISTISGQQQGQIQQQAPPQQLQQQQVAQPGYNFAEKEKNLVELQIQLNKIDEQSVFVKKLIQGIILILTGYNIDDQKAVNDPEKKMQVMCFIVDSVLFKNLNLLQYINTVVIRELFQEIQNINNCPLKSITNADFLQQIESLLYTLTGQDPTPEIKQKKGGGNAIKDKAGSKSDAWSIVLPKRVKIVELPMGIIQCVFGLASSNFEYIPKLLKELHVSESAVKIVDQIIKQVVDMGVFGGKQMAIGGAQQDPKKAKEIQELMKKISEGSATNQDMFKAIDEDGTKSISKSEYGTLAKRLGMNLSEHRINEIFANIKKGKSAQNQDALNEKEFDSAMKYLQQKNTDMALDFLGISPALLTMLLIQGAIILLLIFIFIFLGIQAFALGGTFGAVVNSILPMAAGGGAGSKSEKVSEQKGDDDQIGDSVEKTQKIIQSDKI